MTEWIAVAQDRVGKIEDIAICNSLALARQYADTFAKVAPAHAIVTIFESHPVEKQAGKLATKEPLTWLSSDTIL